MPVNQFLRCAQPTPYAAAQSHQELHFMSSSDRGRDETPGAHRDAAAPSDSPPTGAEAYASWLDRMQRARARQAAITRNLYTWSNYRTGPTRSGIPGLRTTAPAATPPSPKNRPLREPSN